MSSVWVQLYYEGKPSGQADEIEPIPKNIAALKTVVKVKRKEELTHCSAAMLVVYPPKSSRDEKEYNPGKKLEEVIGGLKNTTPPTSDDHPLVVVAPAPRQPQQQPDVQDQRAPAPGLDIQAMAKFFNQDVPKLELDATDHMSVARMGWFDHEISSVYWRRCYSYILCSTIAFFEKAYTEYHNAPPDQSRNKRSMVLTGVQGTGKSILGAIIGLFMAKLFGWRVHYMWTKKEFSVGDGDEERTIHIVDLSRENVPDYPSGFLLIVSSANNSRWKDIKQQQTWTEDKGNYCFIDAATEREVEAIAAKSGDVAAEAALHSFKFVGGVPRLCLQPPETARQKVDDAVSVYRINQLVNRLSVLDDAVDETPKVAKAVGEKVYPGLVGHIVPTNSFRNYFKISIPSPYVAKALMAREEVDTEEKLQEFMKNLLEIPKARGFAGWVWEPLLTKKMRDEHASLTIVGSELPVNPTGASIRELLQASASDIDFLSFESMGEFQLKAQEYVSKKGPGDFLVFAKATSDTFAAIDAILMISKGTIFTIAALQLTVAEKYHSVLQSMIIEFVNACSTIRKGIDMPKPELWFLQPEQSLSYFGFVNLQAMEFDQVTFPSTPSPAATTAAVNPRRSTRIRYRTQVYGDWVPNNRPEGRLKSNKRTYWDMALQSLQQFVGIVRIEEDTTTNQGDNSITSAFCEALNKATTQTAGVSANAVDPELRTWAATTKIMNDLDGYIHPSLMAGIQRDMAEDKQALEAAGMNLDSPNAGFVDAMDES